MESTGDEERLAVLFTSWEGISRELVALDKDPGGRSARTELVEVLCAPLSVSEPVLQTPSMSLFL